MALQRKMYCTARIVSKPTPNFKIVVIGWVIVSRYHLVLHRLSVTLRCAPCTLCGPSYSSVCASVLFLSQGEDYC